MSGTTAPGPAAGGATGIAGCDPACGVLVLGVGNILLADEGIGVRVVEALQAGWVMPDGVELVDGGTAGMDLMDLLESRDHVVVVDAVRLNAEPGTIIVLRDEEVPAFFQARISPHQLGIADVLAGLRLLGREPRNLTLIGVVPESLEMSLSLSPRLAALVDDLVAQTLAILARLGLSARPRTAADGPPAARPLV